MGCIFISRLSRAIAKLSILLNCWYSPIRHPLQHRLGKAQGCHVPRGSPDMSTVLGHRVGKDMRFWCCETWAMQSQSASGPEKAPGTFTCLYECHQHSHAGPFPPAAAVGLFRWPQLSVRRAQRAHRSYVTVIRCFPKLHGLWSEKVAVLLTEQSSWQPGRSSLVPQKSTAAEKLQDGGCASSSQDGCQAGQASSFLCRCMCLVVLGSGR